MYTILLLLTVIALAEVGRLYLTFRKDTKRSHFKQRLVGVRKTIWDLEFKRFKTREIREDVRKEYDDRKSRIFLLDQQIADFPKDKPQEEKNKLEEEKVRLEGDVKRFEGQMKQIDIEVNGSKPTEEYPEGVAGITSQIDSLHEVETMIVDWLKRA